MPTDANLLQYSKSARLRTPTFPYPGAKGRLSKSLVEMMPRSGRLYIEPFAGRGNVFFRAATAGLHFKQFQLNDIATAPFFEALAQKGASITVPERTREEYTLQKSRYLAGDPEALLLEPYLTFSGGGYMKGGFGGNRSATVSGYTHTLRYGSYLLVSKQANITGLDWKNLGLESLGKDDFVFLDPPYFGADVRAYSNKFDHAGMIDMLRGARCKWMLTEYDQPFYREAFGVPCFEKPVQLACDGRGTQRRIECVWTNYRRTSKWKNGSIRSTSGIASKSCVASQKGQLTW